MNGEGRQVWWQLLRWPIALGVLVWLISANADGIRELMAAGMLWRWIGLAAGLRILAILLASLRWSLLLKGQGIELAYWRVARLFATGYVCNFLLPGTVGGDVARAGMVAADSQNRRMRGAATVPLDRMLGLLSFVVTGAVMGLIQWQTIPEGILRTSVILLACLGGAGLTGLVGLLMFRFPSRSQPSSQHAETSEGPSAVSSAEQRRRALGHELLYGLGLLRESRSAVLLAFTLALIGHSMLSMAMFSCLKAFPAAEVPVGPLAHLWIVPSAEVPAALLPLPGGVGAREGTLALLYGALASTPAVADQYRETGVVVAASFSTVSVCLAIGIAALLAMTGDPQRSSSTVEHDGSLRERPGL